MADEFSEPVKRVLATRVGNVCSNPECRALTSGPQENPAKALNIGVAAHITAASAGGPRSDPQLLPEERSSPSNGIWLCQNCAKLVDNDPPRFTVDLLEKWKAAAESEARKCIRSEERSSPSNGIWLCQNCAKLVDNDPPRFTVDLLEKWKAAAESEARKCI